MTNSYVNIGDPAVRLGKARSASINAAIAALEAAFDLLPEPAALQTNSVAYAEAIGSNGSYSAFVDPWPGDLVAGQRVRIRVNHTNPGGGETFALNSFGSNPIRDNNGAVLAQGMMIAGTIVTLTYASGLWQLDQVAAITVPANGSVTSAKIASNAVTNAKLATMSEGTIKGRGATAGTGSPTDLSASQVRTILALTDPAFSFYRGNILGSVSQSGGIPIGALIESGSGANGEFTRLASGLQICRLDNLAVPFNTSADCFATWTFPSAFSTTDDLVIVPTIIPSAASGNTTGITNRANLGAPMVGSVSTSSCHVRIHRITGTTDFSSGQSLNVSLLAIGRWF